MVRQYHLLCHGAFHGAVHYHATNLTFSSPLKEGNFERGLFPKYVSLFYCLYSRPYVSLSRLQFPFLIPSSKFFFFEKFPLAYFVIWSPRFVISSHVNFFQVSPNSSSSFVCHLRLQKMFYKTILFDNSDNSFSKYNFIIFSIYLYFVLFIVENLVLCCLFVQEMGSVSGASPFGFIPTQVVKSAI